jgi:hypothetical protein
MGRGAYPQRETGAAEQGLAHRHFRQAISMPSAQEKAAGVVARLSTKDGHLFHMRVIDRGDWLGPDDGVRLYDGQDGYAGPLVELYEATVLADRATSLRGWFLGRWPLDSFIGDGFAIEAPGLEAGGPGRRYPNPSELKSLASWLRSADLH